MSGGTLMEGDDGEDIIGIASTILWEMPVLMLRICVSYMRTKRSMRRAVRSFRKGIRDEGLPPEVVDSLCMVYDEGTSIFRQIFGTLIHDLPIQPR